MIKQVPALLLAGAALAAAGAARAQPYQSQPYAAQPYQAQPYQAQPYQMQPGQMQPGQVQPYQMQPGAMSQGQLPPGAQGVPPGQMPPEMAGMMHLAARNQLGVLEYCQAQGYVGPDVVQLQRQQIAALPPAQVGGLDQAEAAGRQGTVDAGGRQVSLAQAAQSHGTTVAELCGQVGAMLHQQMNGLQGDVEGEPPQQ